MNPQPKNKPAFSSNGTADRSPSPHAEPMLKLTVHVSSVLPVNAVITVNSILSIGRDRAPGARLRLKEMRVSKHHASIEFQDGFFLIDHGSLHGSFVNGIRVSEPRMEGRIEFFDGYVIAIGTSEFVAHFHDGFVGCECDYLKGLVEIPTEEMAKGFEDIKPKIKVSEKSKSKVRIEENIKSTASNKQNKSSKNTSNPKEITSTQLDTPNDNLVTVPTTMPAYSFTPLETSTSNTISKGSSSTTIDYTYSPIDSLVSPVSMKIEQSKFNLQYTGWKRDYDLKKQIVVPILKINRDGTGDMDMFNNVPVSDSWRHEFPKKKKDDTVQNDNLPIIEGKFLKELFKGHDRLPYQLKSDRGRDGVQPMSYIRSYTDTVRIYDTKFQGRPAPVQKRAPYIPKPSQSGVPARPPPPKTVKASIHTKISESNKGSSLLRKMGWSEGSGLGMHGEGRVEPVGMSLQMGQRGLGYRDNKKARKD